MATSNSILVHGGATQAELGQMFHIHHREVSSRLAGLMPCGKRGSFDLYNVRDAARLLVDPFDETETVERILRMNHTQLPKMLSKEYWTAQRLKQQYEREAADLWPTTQVVELAGEAFKTLRLSLQLLADTIEREAGLSEKQRAIVLASVDSALNDMRERLVDGFKNRRAAAGGGPAPPGEDDGDAEL